MPDRTPGGPERSGGLEAKRELCRAGCRLRMQLRGKPKCCLRAAICGFDRLLGLLEFKREIRGRVKLCATADLGGVSRRESVSVVLIERDASAGMILGPTREHWLHSNDA